MARKTSREFPRPSEEAIEASLRILREKIFQDFSKLRALLGGISSDLRFPEDLPPHERFSDTYP
jgi:hypothetical protein